MVVNRNPSDETRDKNPPVPESRSGRESDRKDKKVGDSDKIKEREATNSESSPNSSSSPSEAEEGGDDSAEEQAEDSDDEEIRLLLKEKAAKKLKKNAGKSVRKGNSSISETVPGKKLQKQIVEEEEEGEEENEMAEGSVCKFPMTRIHKIMKDPDSSSRIAQEAIFLANKASEKFLELYCREAYACAFLNHKTQVSYDHLASVVSKRKRFDFLSDIVPARVKAADALAVLPVSDE